MPYLERVMELSQILNALSDDGQEKTASDATTEGALQITTPSLQHLTVPCQKRNC